MAQEMLKSTQLRLIFETGLNDKGEPIFKTKSFNNVKKEAEAEQIYQVAQAISTLCTHPLVTVERNNSFDVIA
ncbi:DUF1659 domain-containing protein [Bacillus marasmi]|uniref:DUF1659 domain-containing protein n=1 Tax=Bacillus marasmi TaxID=1926279 RepID=UPI0011CB53D7|nr:DUF1659 domain-containing protein [Bacillus marasmi]